MELFHSDFYSTFADWMSTSQSLCAHVSIALKLTWKIPVKQRFDPVNTEGDTVPFLSVWWKRYAQMQRTRSLQGLSHMLALTHATMTMRQKCSKLLTWINGNGSCENQMLPKQHAWNTHYTLRFGVLFLGRGGVIRYNLILKYGTRKSKQTDTNMFGEC